jgi:hypothetical protein
MSYTAQLSPWAPPTVILVLAWLATAAEMVLGIALVLGFLARWAGLLSGILLLLFALGMCMGTGVKSALAYFRCSRPLPPGSPCLRADLTPRARMGGNGRPVDGSVPRRYREIEEGGRRPPGPRHLVHRGAEMSRVDRDRTPDRCGRGSRPVVESVCPSSGRERAFERSRDGRTVANSCCTPVMVLPSPPAVR